MKDSKNREFNIAVITVFLLILILPTLIWAMFSESISVWYAERSTLEEKRTLVSFPQEFTSSWLVELEQWFSDHTPFRDLAIGAESTAEQTIDTAYRKNILPVLSELITPEWYRETPQIGRDGSELPYLAPISEKLAVYGRGDWLFVDADDSIAYYQGTNIPDEGTMYTWCERFEIVNKYCESKGARAVLLIGPDKEQVFPEKMPSYPVFTDYKREEVFLDYMSQHSTLTCLYPLHELKEANSLYDTYYMQDTHWNLIGGYVGAMSVLEALGMETRPLETLAVTETEKTGGDLSNFCGYTTTYTDYKIDYRPEISCKCDRVDGISVEYYESDSDNPAHLIIIGDSFRDAVVDTLKKEFAHTTVIHRKDLRSHEVAETLAGLEEGDVVLMVPGERGEYQMAMACVTIRDILQNMEAFLSMPYYPRKQ